MKRLLLLALLLAACNAERPRDQFDPERGVVFPASRAVLLTVQCVREPLHIDGTWLPAPADIERLEQRLAVVLAKRLRELPPNGQQRSVAAYYRQYGGISVGDKRAIYINGLRENYVLMAPDRNAWRTQPVVVCGGGDWYFAALYDPQTDQIGAFKFNP